MSEPLLTGRFGHPYVYEASCESTQELLGADLPEGALALCDEQTRGRGRLPGAAGPRRRAPQSSARSRCARPSDRIVSELSLVAGTAVAEAIEEAVGPRRPGQVAERRHAEPAQGRRHPGRGRRRPRRRGHGR